MRCVLIIILALLRLSFVCSACCLADVLFARNKQAHVDKIYSLFSKLGAERTGVITFAMFEEKIHSPAVREYFDILGLDVWDVTQTRMGEALFAGTVTLVWEGSVPSTVFFIENHCLF